MAAVRSLVGANFRREEEAAAEERDARRLLHSTFAPALDERKKNIINHQKFVDKSRRVCGLFG